MTRKYGICKRYGDTSTNLTLTAKARKFYAGTSPMYIYEYENDGEYRYTWDMGDGETRLMTAEALNRDLECLYNETWEQITDAPAAE